MGPERTRPRQKVVAPSSEADTAGDISNPCSASASSILRCSARSVLKLRVPVAVVAFERGGGSARRDGGPSKCACIGGDRSARNIDSSGDFRDIKGAEQLLLVLDVMPSASARIELLAVVASQSLQSVRTLVFRHAITAVFGQDIHSNPLLGSRHLCRLQHLEERLGGSAVC